MLEPLYFGKTLISLKTVDSTNNYSTELLKHGFVAEGTVIMAEDQTAGRGQRGSSWKSEPGANLTFSIILSPSFIRLSDHFNLTRCVSLAVCDALRFLTAEPFMIKWPNDILHRTSKVAGILIETISTGNMISQVIVGIGINVNQEEGLDEFNAESLKKITGKSYDLKDVLLTTCSFLERRYLAWKKRGEKPLENEYLENLFGYQQWLRFKKADEEFLARIVQVNGDGRLVLETSDGLVTAYDLKQIRFILT